MHRWALKYEEERYKFGILESKLQQLELEDEMT